MTGHKHIGSLKKEIKRAVRSGADFNLIKSIYDYSFKLLSIKDPDSLINEMILEVAKENHKSNPIMEQIKQPYSTNEIDYGSELPQFKWQELSIYEKSFATDSKK